MVTPWAGGGLSNAAANSGLRQPSAYDFVNLFLLLREGAQGLAVWPADAFEHHACRLAVAPHHIRVDPHRAAGVGQAERQGERLALGELLEAFDEGTLRA